MGWRTLLVGLFLVVVACGQADRNANTVEEGGTGPGAGVAGGGGSAGQVADAGGSGGSSGGSGGSSGGSGGSSVLLPEAARVAECVSYCEALPYLLPQALCEDWNSSDWAPEFCGLGEFSGCSEYCDAVYQAVSPTCAEVLPAAIRCVAPTYANQSPPITKCWLEECRDQLYTMTSACYGSKEKLAVARARWEASGVVDYQLQYTLSGGETAEVTVRAASEPVATPATALAWTVPLLFDEVERILQTPGAAPDATYHPDLGYVVGLVQRQGCAESDAAVVAGVEVAPLR